MGSFDDTAFLVLMRKINPHDESRFKSLLLALLLRNIKHQLQDY
jgi:hypothetical protein